MEADNQGLTGPDPSRLILGTVQLGMDYGIANRTGQPDLRTARRIVARAWEEGVREFDTAQGYGNSEEVLGLVLEDLGLTREALITTKLGHHLTIEEEALADSIKGSLARLGVSRLAGLLLHKEEQLDLLDQGLAGTLARFKEKGLVRRLGVSVYTPQRALQALETDLIEMIQVPTNILDHRFRRAGVFDRARSKGKRIYIRSVFLQGLLLLSPPELPPAMAYAAPALELVEGLARELGLSRKRLALDYVKEAFPEARVLLGAETPGQVQENTGLWRKPAGENLVRRVEEVFTGIEERVVNPLLWPAGR